MNTWVPCSPVRQKNADANAPDSGVKPMFRYSYIWMPRNVRPRPSVKKRPRIRPRRLFRFTHTSAQCIVNDDDTRMNVLMPVSVFGMSYGSGGKAGYVP